MIPCLSSFWCCVSAFGKLRVLWAGGRVDMKGFGVIEVQNVEFGIRYWAVDIGRSVCGRISGSDSES